MLGDCMDNPALPGGYHDMVTIGYAHKGEAPRKIALWYRVVVSAIVFALRHVVYKVKIRRWSLVMGELSGQTTWKLRVSFLYKSLFSYDG